MKERNGKEMTLWLLLRHDDDWYCDWDSAYGFVVRAKSARKARQIAKHEHEEDRWLDPQRTSCRRLKEDGPAEMILCDYLRG